MKYLPFENYILLTRLPVNEVRNRIAENIEPKRSFRIGIFSKNATRPYEGELWTNTFTINRIINYRNSFLPIINGTYFEKSNGTQINIKMRPYVFVLAFMTFWFGTLGTTCIGIFIAGIIRYKELLQHGFSPMILIPYAMFFFGYGLITIGFKSESRDSKKFLANLLQGYEMNPNEINQFPDPISSIPHNEAENPVIQKQKQPGFPIKRSVLIVVIVIWNLLFILNFWGPFKNKDGRFPSIKGSSIAIGLVLLLSVLALISKDFRKLILKDGRDIDEINRLLYFVIFIGGFILLITNMLN